MLEASPACTPARTESVTGVFPAAALGYTSPAEAQIAATQLFTPGQLSIFDALVNVGAITGAAVSGWLSDTLGRKVFITVPADRCVRTSVRRSKPQ